MKNPSSCLYESEITHQRISPKPHRINHKMFSFYVDLDEIEALTKTVRLIALNKPALYALFDRDHFDASNKPLKEKVIDYISKASPNLKIDRVFALTNFRFIGYVFNPITVFYCFERDQLQCAIAEVGNTFGEKKPYLIVNNGSDILQSRQQKNFYVSPFIKLDAEVVFNLKKPDQRLSLDITTVEDDAPVLVANMRGTRRVLNDKSLLRLTFKYPFVTFFVIAAIHFHALLLWLKNVPFIPKEADAHLQTGVLRPHASLQGDRT